ncbi:MAG TPA: glycosyltransferase [Caulobacteraceae bacterium]|nr:glycosyltransferase [Caulobacteraceae bacterium]
MTLRFDCEDDDYGSEATYRRLVEHIDALAAADGRRRDAQAAAILKSGLFDTELYLATYKDVAASGADPLRHYIESGDEEGRWPNAFFDPVFYRGQFAASGRWPTTALHHYATIGEAAGLRPSAAFDPRRYLEASGLGAWVERPLAHYLWIGRRHGLSPTGRTLRASGEKVTLAPRRAPPALSSERRRRAVNLIGPLDKVGGTGVSARGYLQALQGAGFGPVGVWARRREFMAQASVQSDANFGPFIADAAINVVHMGADTLPLLLSGPDKDLLSGSYNIAVWYWELPTLRPEWWELMDLFHAFWAPTPFIARAISQLTAKPVRLVPPYLSHLSKLNAARPPATDPHPHFVYCFDANSVVERKNPGCLLDAFLEAFPGEAEARLTFKVTYPNWRLPELARLRETAARHGHVQIIDRLLSADELHQLMGSASAYVSPHRSEGLGLTIVEAMALGVPVIATPFGGAEGLVTDDAAWPLNYALVELAEDCGPYPRGYVWAEPDQASLGRALRQAAVRSEVAAKKAAIARGRVLEGFSSPSVVEACRTALQEAGAAAGV